MEVISRAEEYLNYALKNQEDYPEPISRMDYYLLSVDYQISYEKQDHLQQQILIQMDVVFHTNMLGK